MTHIQKVTQQTVENYEAELDREIFGTKYACLDAISLSHPDMQCWRKVMHDCGRDIRNVHIIGELRFIEDFVFDEIVHLKSIGIQPSQIEELKRCYCTASNRNFPATHTSYSYKAIV